MGGFSGCRFCKGRGCLACQKEQERVKREHAWSAKPRDDRYHNQEPDQREPTYAWISAAGQVSQCNRCGCLVRAAQRRRTDAEILRLSKNLDGVCANCAVTEFLYNTYPANMIIDERGPEMLLNPMIGEAFISSGLMDRADMDIREIDWQKVVENWGLPVKGAKGPLNPYRMGEVKRAREARDKYEREQAEQIKELVNTLARRNLQ